MPVSANQFVPLCSERRRSFRDVEVPFCFFVECHGEILCSILVRFQDEWGRFEILISLFAPASNVQLNIVPDLVQ